MFLIIIKTFKYNNLKTCLLIVFLLLTYISSAQTSRTCVESSSNVEQLSFQSGVVTTIGGNNALEFSNVAPGINATVVDLSGLVNNLDTDVVESPSALTSVLNTNVVGQRSAVLRISFYDSTLGDGFSVPIDLSFFATAFDIDGLAGSALTEFVILDSPDAYSSESAGSQITVTQSGIFPAGTITGVSNDGTTNVDTVDLENPDHAFTAYYVNKSTFDYTVGKNGQAQEERFYTLAFRDVIYDSPSTVFNTDPIICGVSLLDGLPQSGVTIELYNSSNVLIDTAITDSNGEFSFDLGSNSGTFSVREINPALTTSTGDSDGGPDFDDVSVLITLNSAIVEFENENNDSDDCLSVNRPKLD